MRVRLKAIALSACLLGFGSSAFAKEKPKLQSATVISQNVDYHTGNERQWFMDGSPVMVPTAQRSNVVVIETAKQRLTLTEMGFGSFIPLLIHGDINYYVEGKHIVIPDALNNGKKHKFAITHSENIAP